MRPNKLRQLWQQGKPAINAWLSLPTSVGAELAARSGFDAVTIDAQHGVVDYQPAVPMLQAISQTDAVPMVRVPWREPGLVMRFLDAGAYGIICPMISNRAEAEHFVSLCRYPPAGMRSFGPLRANMYAGDDYGANANDTVLALAMIETADGVANMAEIATTPGLDGIYVGPSDLSLGLGHPPNQDIPSGIVYDTQLRILDAAKQAGIAACIHCQSPDYGLTMIDKGFDLVTIANDFRTMTLGYSAAVDTMRNGLSA